jgi:hypothetical protein
MEVSETLTLSKLGFFITFPFPEQSRIDIIKAVKSIDISTKQKEIQDTLDEKLAKSLKPLGYFSAVEKDTECNLWLPDFQHAVDFYNPEKKIAIEVEKAEIKRVTHDLLKLINATKTFRAKIKYGVMIVPDKYFVKSGSKPFISTLKQDISFYFGTLLGDANLFDVLIIRYKVTSK